MAHDESRRWPTSLAVALEITWVAVDAFREITHMGGPLEDGSNWTLTRQGLIEAIHAGGRYYLQFEGNAYLVGVRPDHNGVLALNVGVKDTYLLYLLPKPPNCNLR